MMTPSSGGSIGRPSGASLSSKRRALREIRREEAAQVPFSEDDDVIQALTPDRADESLRERILPPAVRG